MKRHFTLGILTLLFVFVLTGCGNYSYEETQIETIVIQCEEGTYHPDPSYMTIANMYYSQKNYGLWTTYRNLAYSNGSYDYNITVNIEGVDYVIVRSEEYEIGQTIIITQKNTYKDSQLEKTEYK